MTEKDSLKAFDVTIINYERDINLFHKNKVMGILERVFPNFSEDLATKRVTEKLLEEMELVRKYGNGQMFDQFKEKLQGIRSDYYRHNILPDSWEQLNEWPELYRNNMVSTLCRLYEWFYLSDDQLNTINKRMIDQIKLGKVKLFDYKTCPYKEDLTSNLWEDMILNKKNIEDYWNKNNLPYLDYRKLKECFNTLKNFIKNPELAPDHLKSYIDSIVEVRSRELDKQFYQNLMIENDPKFIMTKESGSAWSRHPELIDIMKSKYGHQKLDSVVGNFFYGNTEILPKNNAFERDIIKLPLDMDYISISAGKGDGFKTRYVGSPVPVFQNILSPLAKGLEAVQRKNNNIATFDQLTRYIELSEVSDDIFGIDFSGYSDYLNRNSFRFIMLELYGWDIHIVEIIMNILSLPIMVNGKKYPYRYGSMQGIKFDFYIITEVNQLMWALGNIYCNLIQDYAVFVGDDRSEHSLKGSFPEEYIKVQLSISSLFNCVSNLDKTESWKKDGISSFCKMSISKDKIWSSGLSANILLKQKVFATDINSLIKYLLKIKLYDLDLLEENNLIESLVKYFEKDILYVSQALGKVSPLESALSIPLEWGGLAYDHSLSQVKRYLSFIQQFIEKLSQESDYKVNQDFLVLLKLGLKDHKYLNYLTEIKFNYREYSQLFREIDNALSSVFYNEERLKKLRKSLNEYLKVTLERMGPKSISTKNRNNIRYDSDVLFREEISDHTDLFKISPESYEEKAFVRQIIDSNDKNTLKTYMKLMDLKQKVKEKYNIIYYEGFGGKRYSGIKYEGKILRLDCNPNYDYKSDETFIKLDNVKDKDVVEFIYLYNKFLDFSKPALEKQRQRDLKVKAYKTRLLERERRKMSDKIISKRNNKEINSKGKDNK